ncbi:hypothetical protein P3T76_004516 [Phytophthora citrophthora]|uniref:Uncharacterized protein n=1 Tax=Phytophthora citrophthora TaxID=4793 RepID=A0AAD9LRY9_9STRA|nr:hypothetical protein P3T76_004516 [Phytophthora citrophthora]
MTPALAAAPTIAVVLLVKLSIFARAVRSRHVRISGSRVRILRVGAAAFALHPPQRRRRQRSELTKSGVLCNRPGNQLPWGAPGALRYAKSRAFASHLISPGSSDRAAVYHVQLLPSLLQSSSPQQAMMTQMSCSAMSAG